MWAVGKVLLFISTSSLTGKCSRLRLSRCACPCMILSSALKISPQGWKLRQGNTRSKGARSASQPLQRVVCMQEAGQTEGGLLCGGYATLTPHLCSQWLGTLPEKMPVLFLLVISMPHVVNGLLCFQVLRKSRFIIQRQDIIAVGGVRELNSQLWTDILPSTVYTGRCS